MLWRRRARGRFGRPGPDGVVPLATLRPGERAEVVSLDLGCPRRLQRLSTLGLVPGVELFLRQTWPAFVIQLGETELALDKVVADHILVRRLAPRTPTRGGRRHRRRGWRE